MKSIQQKDNSLTNSNHPFFQKERSHKPFFNSSPIQAKLTVNQPNDPYEKEADAMADKVLQRIATPSVDANASNNTNNLSIQRKCAECEHEEEKIQKKEADTPANTTLASPQSAQAKPTVAAARFIVDNNAATSAGQMQKTIFLSRLKEEICITVNLALAGTLFSSDNCPYITAAFAKHQHSSPLQLEQLIARYEPSTMQAQSADDLIQRMKVRVYAAAKQWVKNGGDLSGTTQIFGGMAGGIAGAIGGAASTVSSIASAAGGIASTIGGIFFKANDGGATATQSPQAVMQSLGGGQSLDSSSKGKMESAFGTSFSNVEVHTDSNAANLSSNMNARAFTVGNHIAFASGEHKPGTLVGDTLMAHELAHVLQQRSAEGNQSAKNGVNQMGSMEEDADNTTTSAALSFWANTKGKTSKMAKEALPRLKSGLQIQSCSNTVKKCPTGKKWGVVSTAGVGPVCVCRWKCVYDDSPVSGSYSDGPQLHCNPRPCPKTEYEDVGEDYGFEVEGQKKEVEPEGETGIGGHMSPLTAPAMCGCLPLDIEGGAKTDAPLKYVDIDVTDLAGMKGRSTRTGKIQPGAEVPKGSSPTTGKQPAAIIGGKGSDPVPIKPTETSKPKGPDYSKMSLSKLRKIAPDSPEATNALLDRYRSRGLGNLKNQYGTDATAKALLDEYYAKPTASLQKLEASGDKLAKQVLDDVYGEKNAAGLRPLAELKPSDKAKTDELRDSLEGERAKSGIERKDLRRELKQGQLQGGTMGVGDSDIPGLEGTQSVGKSPRAGGKEDPTFKPPTDDPRAKGHAEQNLAGQFDSRIQQLLDSKKLTPEQLKGKTVRFHIEEEVCSVCRQGLNPGAKTSPGVLKQFSLKYPELTIEVTAVGTSEVIRIKNGQVINE